MTIEQDNGLETKLKNWLKEQGYPLEMSVALGFQKAGMQVKLSDFYQDPETGDSREIDVTALKIPIEDEKRKVLLHASCCIECKLSKEKPWVIFTQGDNEKPKYGNIICSEPLYSFYKSLFEGAENRFMPLPSIDADRVGYATIQTFAGNNTDVAFKAVTSSLKASFAKSKHLDDLCYSLYFRENKKNRHPTVFVNVVFPAIVTEGRLFNCSLNHSGELQLEEVDHSTIHWKGFDHPIYNPTINIFGISALPNFIARFNKAVEFLDDFVSGYEDDIYKEIMKSYTTRRKSNY